MRVVAQVIISADSDNLISLLHVASRLRNRLSPSEFINLISSEAHEISEKTKKKTIAPEHVVQAVQVSSFYRAAAGRSAV